MKYNDKINHSIAWFEKQPREVQQKALRDLFDHCFQSEWLGVWEPGDREEMAEESGRDIEEYEAPYFRTCGDSLGSL